jgi:hypothetical protein
MGSHKKAVKLLSLHQAVKVVVAADSTFRQFVISTD